MQSYCGGASIVTGVTLALGARQAQLQIPPLRRQQQVWIWHHAELGGGVTVTVTTAGLDMAPCRVRGGGRTVTVTTAGLDMARIRGQAWPCHRHGCRYGYGHGYGEEVVL